MDNKKQKILDEIVKSVQQIKNGELVLTIHNKRVVEIEKREIKKFQGHDKTIRATH